MKGWVRNNERLEMKKMVFGIDGDVAADPACGGGFCGRVLVLSIMWEKE